MTLGEARKLLGWSQARLAAESGETKSTISDIELGRNNRPAYVVVMHIMGALHRGGLSGVTPEDVFPVTEAVAL